MIDLRTVRAAVTGLTVGTAPMVWADLTRIGGLEPRIAHVLGALVLTLILLDRTGAATVPRRLVLGIGLIGALVIGGAAANSLTFDSAYWPMGEVVRLAGNLVLAIGVGASLADLDRRLARVVGWTTLAALSVAVGWWLFALHRTAVGLDGAVVAALTGDTRTQLFGAHLPAVRWLYGQEVVLGVRHTPLFGMLVAVVVARLVAVDRVLRWATAAATVMTVGVVVLASSRSAMLAVGAGVVAVLASSGDVRGRLRGPMPWIAAATAALVAATPIAGEVLGRFTDDTASLESRQVNVAEVLDADWTVAGLPALDPGVDSPHNTLVELAAAGGIAALAGAGLAFVLAAFLVLGRRTTPLGRALGLIVIVRMLTAARGSLDTSALLALGVGLAVTPTVLASLRRDRSTRWDGTQRGRAQRVWVRGGRARTSTSSSSIAASTLTSAPIVPPGPRAWRR